MEELLLEELQFFLTKQPSCLIIANNTLHKALDAITPSLNLQIPVFHAGYLCAEDAVKNGYQTILLLGTKFTMEDGFFAKYFEERGIKVIIPNLEEREEIAKIQAHVASGVQNEAFKISLQKIISGYKVNAVCLSCTELPLVINKLLVPIINPGALQIKEAISFAISK